MWKNLDLKNKTLSNTKNTAKAILIKKNPKGRLGAVSVLVHTFFCSKITNKYKNIKLKAKT